MTLFRRRDEPDLIARMRKLWRVPPTYSVPCSARARVVPSKVRTVAEWIKRYGRRAS